MLGFFGFFGALACWDDQNDVFFGYFLITSIRKQLGRLLIAVKNSGLCDSIKVHKTCWEGKISLYGFFL
jgi:hypothetical protein